MQQLDTNLFETTAPAKTIARTGNEIITTTSLIIRPSKTTQGNVEYVRLSDAEHAYLRNAIGLLDTARFNKDDPDIYVGLNGILDRPSGIWGSVLRKFSTLREVFEGVADKLAKPHKYVKGRKGEDLSVKQLTAINTVLVAVGADEITIPAKEA
jgi:hypothetical protein